MDRRKFCVISFDQNIPTDPLFGEGVLSDQSPQEDPEIRQERYKDDPFPKRMGKNRTEGLYVHLPGSREAELGFLLQVCERRRRKSLVTHVIEGPGCVAERCRYFFRRISAVGEFTGSK